MLASSHWNPELSSGEPNIHYETLLNLERL